MSPKRKQPVPPPDKDDDDEFDALPTPPKVVKPLFEQNCPVEIRPLKFSDKATDDKAGRPTGNFALWVNPTRKFNRKAGVGDPGFNNNQAIETALATPGLGFFAKWAPQTQKARQCACASV